MPDTKPTTPQPTPNSPVLKEEMAKLKSYLVNTISRQLETNPPAVNMRREVITQHLQQAYTNINIPLPASIKDQLFHDILDDLLGFGPIQPLLEDNDVSEIMINGAHKVYIERKGKLTKTNITFESDEQVLRLIDRIIMPLGRRIDSDTPTVDARLPDGSRVNAVIPPVAIDGPTVTIRKFQKGKLTIEQLIRLNSITSNMAEFLRACILTKLNIIISGGTGSGKTTLLNALSSYIPEDERIVTIEDAAELRLQQEHVVRMEAKMPNLDGSGQVTVRDLVRNALRMRPDRIVVGEVRGGETLDMLQAMNTGHDGSLTTLHANSCRDALSRMETMTLMAGLDLPIKVVREQISSAIDLIIQIARLKDGTRKVIAITEVAGMEGDMVVLSDIFKFEQIGIGANQQILGELKPTGIRPLFSTRMEVAGYKLGPEVYGANLSEMLRNRR
jgi:pilus assembly protein CpaF